MVLVVLGAMPMPMFVLGPGPGPGPGIVLAVGWGPVWGPVEAGRRLRVWWKRVRRTEVWDMLGMFVMRWDEGV